MHNRFGGELDYARLADTHRPTDPRSLAAEVRRLASQGLSLHDVAAALRINLEQLRKLLAAYGEDTGTMKANHMAMPSAAIDAERERFLALPVARQQEVIRRLHAKGHDAQTIASMTGLRVETIASWSSSDMSRHQHRTYLRGCSASGA